MSVKIPARELHGMLTDLLRTASADKTLPMLCAVQLRSDRHEDADVLIGTSTDRFVLGQCYAPADGEDLPPTVLVRDDVEALLRQLDKRDDSPVQLDRDGDTFTAQHTSGSFTATVWTGSQFPSVAGLLDSESDPVADADIGLTPDLLAKFPPIAKRRKREGQFRIVPGAPRKPIHVYVGERYHALLMPTREGDGFGDRCPTFSTAS